MVVGVSTARYQDMKAVAVDLDYSAASVSDVCAVDSISTMAPEASCT